MANLFPKRAGAYNDVMICCPCCHRQIVIFAGYRKNHLCSHCGAKIKDRLWKQNNAAYKCKKKEMNKE